MWKWLKSIDCGILFRSAQVESDFFYALFFAALMIITNHISEEHMNAMARGFQISRSRRNPPETVCFTDILHSRKFIYHEQLWFSQDCTACMCACALVCVCVWCVCLITKHQWLVHSLYGQKYWHPFFRREKALPNCGNKDGNIIHVLKNCISTSVSTVLKYMKWLYPYVHVIGVWRWVFGSRSAFKVTPKTPMVLFVELGGINLYFQEHRHAA